MSTYWSKKHFEMKSNAVYLTVLFLSFLHFTNGQFAGYCTRNETQVASESAEKIVSEYLVEEFLADDHQRTIDVSLKFNSSAICQLQLLNLKKFECTFFFSELTWNKLGQVTGNEDYRKLIRIIDEHGFWTQNASLSGLQNGSRLIFGLNCSVEFHNGSSSALFSEKWEASTTRFLEAPTLLKGYVHSHLHRIVEESRWIVLEWNRVESWDGEWESKYQAECIEYLDACKTNCSELYGECSSCIEQKKDGDLWKKSTDVPFFYTSALISERDKDGNLKITSTSLEVAVCSVRVINKITMGDWANIVVVNVTYPNPPSRLLVSGKMHGENVAGMIMPGLLFEGSEPLEMAYMVHIPSNYSASSGVEHQCCVLLYPISLEMASPRFWTYDKRIQRPVPTDFCRNWVQRTVYSLSQCMDDNTTTCVYMDDEEKFGSEQSKLLYKSAKNTTLHAIACNPYKDVVVATSKQADGSFNLVVYHATPDQSYQLNMSEKCPTFKPDDPRVLSRALEMDWKNDGKLMVVTSDQEVWLLDLEYQRPCTAEKLSQLNISMGQSVLELTADWQNVYWRTNDRQVTIQDRQENSQHKQLGSLIKTTPDDCGVYDHSPCEGLEMASFDSVFSIKAVAPEMHTYLKASEYFPVLEEVNVTMIDGTTWKVDVKVRWNAKYSSLRTPVHLELRYREFSDHDNDGEEDYGCTSAPHRLYCTSIQYEEAFRSQFISKTLRNLRKNTKYHIEVIIKVANEGMYHGAEELQSMRKNSTLGLFFKGTEKSITDWTNVTRRSSDKNKTFWIVVAALGLVMLLFLLLLVYGICFYWTRVRPLRHLQRISKNQVTRIALLGSGHFGEVWHGLLASKGTKHSVAIKYLHESSHGEAKKCFLEEAIILGHLNHTHIIKIIGISLDSKPNMIVLEFFQGGSLCNLLQKDGVSVPDQLKVAIDVCKACVYLDEKGYIHRDIRSANVLIRLHSSGWVALAVLADFGLAKDRGAQMEPYTTTAPQFPIRYSAPECFNGRFSTKSDVFMYGILLWEIFSKARVPHASIPNEELGHRIQNENARPCQPENCPDQIYSLMKDCWEKEPEYRPDFKTVFLTLQILKKYFLVNKDQQPINDLDNPLDVDFSSVPIPVSSVETAVRPLSHEYIGIPGQMDDLYNVCSSTLDAERKVRLAYY